MHSRTRDLKKRLAACRSTDSALDVLHNAYEGEECWVFTCGPSLNDVSAEDISRVLQGRLGIAVKQAMFKAPEADFHVFNRWHHQKYPKRGDDCIGVELKAPKDPVIYGQSPDVRFEMEVDPSLKTDERLQRSLAATSEFERYTLEQTQIRPWGPGIMYEVVMFLAVHLGVRRIVCIGWDLGSAKAASLEHFYAERDFGSRIADWQLNERLQRITRRVGGDRTLRGLNWAIRHVKRRALHDLGYIYNRTPVQVGENDLIIRSSEHLNAWLKARGVELTLVSDRSLLHPGIPRMTLAEAATI
ncbi:hypothetical protein ACERK3_00625 [Phycisphaerales bacterium AB-hyl4]|uniref:Restriction endonuclease n=1 Tax=Natronomicrosphaera hydrolytica TaxID=3242702 RepID=A0ABV4U0T8_9BACT